MSPAAVGAATKADGQKEDEKKTDEEKKEPDGQSKMTENQLPFFKILYDFTSKLNENVNSAFMELKMDIQVDYAKEPLKGSTLNHLEQEQLHEARTYQCCKQPCLGNELKKVIFSKTKMETPQKLEMLYRLITSSSSRAHTIEVCTATISGHIKGGGLCKSSQNMGREDKKPSSRTGFITGLHKEAHTTAAESSSLQGQRQIYELLSLV
ncbi:hypothetical protein DUI87_10323 [Hirundo rustica rustica]|uniref:Uncharacterized protein n=1 Tax=Hirundo rustica rustica TaxID=333673 RepID=A0A3M0KHT0_HIRRU|nr:hypothetical protein DUI87_10323 [Hirundo rustica rustica]